MMARIPLPNDARYVIEEEKDAIISAVKVI